MGIVASSLRLSPLVCDGAPGPAKRGAGGSGRRGLPPYLEEGVPGRGLPLRLAGSYEAFVGEGRPESVEPREGEYDRADGARLGEYGM
jgi:hypothetical protein